MNWVDFSYIGFEERVPLDYSLRLIRDKVDIALWELFREFARLYSQEEGSAATFWTIWVT